MAPKHFPTTLASYEQLFLKKWNLCNCGVSLIYTQIFNRDYLPRSVLCREFERLWGVPERFHRAGVDRAHPYLQSLAAAWTSLQKDTATQGETYVRHNLCLRKKKRGSLFGDCNLPRNCWYCWTWAEISQSAFTCCWPITADVPLVIPGVFCTVFILKDGEAIKVKAPKKPAATNKEMYTSCC